MKPISDIEMENVTGGTQIPYVVRPGDTMDKLAEKYHCTVEQLCRWNNIDIKKANELLVGQKLIIRF
jgi:LysM repeat protein